MVFVTEIPKDDQSTLIPAEKSRLDFPGIPGLSQDYADFRTYSFDIDNQTHNRIKRPEIKVSVVISKNVDKKRVSFFKKVLPQIARIKQAEGDLFSLKVGPLNKIAPPEKPEKTFMDTFMKYKKELLSLFIGLICALAGLIVLHGTFALFSAKTAAKAASQVASQPSPPTAPLRSKEEDDENSNDGSKTSKSARSIFGSKDAVFDLMTELKGEADTHPARFAALLTAWIQEGSAGQYNAGTVLAIFEMKTTNKIMAKMVPSDLDLISDNIAVGFDLEDNENLHILIKAKQDLLKLVAQEKTEPRTSEVNTSFLKTLENDMLHEILADEPPETLALVSFVIPTHRIQDLVKELSPDDQTLYFNAICKVNMMPESLRTATFERLYARYTEINNFIFTRNDRAKTVLSALKSITDPLHKETVFNAIRDADPDTFNIVQSQVYFFNDLYQLSPKSLLLLVSEFPADRLASALTDCPKDFQEKVTHMLPKASRDIFVYERQRPNPPQKADVLEARNELLQLFERLVGQKLILLSDLNRQPIAPFKLVS